VGVGRELKLRDRGGSDMLVPCKTLLGAKVSWVQDPRFWLHPLAAKISCNGYKRNVRMCGFDTLTTTMAITSLSLKT